MWTPVGTRPGSAETEVERRQQRMAENQPNTITVSLEPDADGNFKACFTPNPLPVCKKNGANRVVVFERSKDNYPNKSLVITCEDTYSRNAFVGPWTDQLRLGAGEKGTRTLRPRLGLDQRPDRKCFSGEPNYRTYTYKIGLHAEDSDGTVYGTCSDGDHGDIEVEC